MTPVLMKSLGLSEQSLELTTGMANAAYAFGTVAAVQLAVHLPQRRLLVVYAALLLIGSVLAAAAWTSGMFIAGHVMQGMCTSLLLIAAVPPLVIGWPAAKTRWSATTMNMCIFGAVAVGPVIGGYEAGSHAWRPLMWVVAGVSALALPLALLTFEDQPPADSERTLGPRGPAARRRRVRRRVLRRLAAHHPPPDERDRVPAACSGAPRCWSGLVLHQYTVRRPLMPVADPQHDDPRRRDLDRDVAPGRLP